MENSRTLDRSRSFTSARFHLRVIAFVIATLTGVWGCGGTSSQSGGNQPPPPAPTLTAISPNTAAAGGAAFTLTITGTNFVAASTVNFGGAAPATTFISSTQLSAAIPASSIGSTGTLSVTVTNPAPGGGTSNSVNFTVTSSSNSVPSISTFFPGCVPAGEQLVDAVDNVLTVFGDNFVDGSVVRWNGADLPTTFNSNSGQPFLSAQVTASDIAAAGTAAITVFNPPPGGGSSASLTFTITPGAVDPQAITVDAAGTFAYVASQGCAGGTGGYVSMYSINPTTGALAVIGSPVYTLDLGTSSITVDPLGKFAYTANEGVYATDGSISAYSIDQTTGALTPTSGGISGDNPDFCCFTDLVVHPSGKFAYVANGDSFPRSVSMFTIANGALTYFGTIAAEGFPTSVVVDPSGQFVYVAAETDSGTPGPGSVSMYAINATTGALTSLGSIATGTMIAESSSNSIALDPTGAFAYVTNSGSNNVSMYSIDATTGVLTSAGLIDAGTTPVSVAVDPSGKFAYVVNINSNDVSMYTINAATGALTSTGTIAAGMNPTSIAIHPSGKFAYVTNSNSNDVSIYSIDSATGALTLIGTIGT